MWLASVQGRDLNTYSARLLEVRLARTMPPWSLNRDYCGDLTKAVLSSPPAAAGSIVKESDTVPLGRALILALLDPCSDGVDGVGGGGGEGGALVDEPLAARPAPRHTAVQARVPGSAVVSAAHQVPSAVRVGVTITCRGKVSSNITYRSDAHLVQDRTDLGRCNMTTR